MNFTLSLREVWGPSPRLDRQKGFFSSLLESLRLVDVEQMLLLYQGSVHKCTSKSWISLSPYLISMGLPPRSNNFGINFSAFSVQKWVTLLWGDTNFTLNRREVSGTTTHVDHLVKYFQNWLESRGLVDVEPLKLGPTWSNNRHGNKAVIKTLDRFMITDQVLQEVRNYRSWICPNHYSDHFPIMLELELIDPRPCYPIYI